MSSIRMQLNQGYEPIYSFSKKWHRAKDHQSKKKRKMEITENSVCVFCAQKERKREGESQQ